MPVFSLPLNSYSSAPESSTISPHPSSKKRKRTGSPTAARLPDLEDAQPTPDDETSSAFATLLTSNPLSLGPDEVRQYKIAGLSLDRELPSATIRDFPHRSLPRSPSDAKAVIGSDDDDGAEAPVNTEDRSLSRRSRVDSAFPSSLRQTHFATLTAVMHRCLLAGDIVRASRAWAMLLRTEIDGRPMELRKSAYWAIGAELLLRRDRSVAIVTDDADSVEPQQEARVDVEADRNHDGDANVISSATKPKDPHPNWTTEYGVAATREYYERLILQHPYRKQFPHAINALTFWPAMLSCEIYGIQAKYTADMHTLASKDDSSSMASDDDHDGSTHADNEEDEAGLFGSHDVYDDAAQQEARLRAREVRARRRGRHAREKIRGTARAAAEDIARRLDALMTLPPYSEDVTLLGLRANVALYIGDLAVVFDLDGHGDGSGNGDGDGNAVMLEWSWEERQEYNRGIARRRRERDMAAEIQKRIATLARS